MADLVLQIGGMDCRHCARAVSAIVRDVPGVRTVAVDVPSGTLTVSGSVVLATLLAVLRATGHEVRVLSGEVD